jgi:hypothetical protein
MHTGVPEVVAEFAAPDRAFVLAQMGASLVRYVVLHFS